MVSNVKVLNADGSDQKNLSPGVKAQPEARSRSTTTEKPEPSSFAAILNTELCPNFDEVFNWHRIESLRFVVQTGLSIAIMTLCIGKLVFTGTDSNEKALYWGGITSIVTWWMPSPGASRQSSKDEK